MKFVLIILLFASCAKVKEVTRTVVQIDSTVVEQHKDSIRALKETISFYEEIISNREDTRIEFDTVYRDTGRVYNKVVVRNDGSISAEGPIKLLTLSKNYQQQIINNQRSLIDSQSVELDKKEAALHIKAKEVIKYVKIRPMWWIYLIVAVGAIALWETLIRKYVIRLIRIIKRIPL